MRAGFVGQILRSAMNGTMQQSQVHLAYSLGSTILISVNLENLELGSILNLPFIERYNVYRLKSVLNVGSGKVKHIYHSDDDPLQFFIPNVDLCTKTKDIH